MEGGGLSEGGGLLEGGGLFNSKFIFEKGGLLDRGGGLLEYWGLNRDFTVYQKYEILKICPWTHPPPFTTTTNYSIKPQFWTLAAGRPNIGMNTKRSHAYHSYTITTGFCLNFILSHFIGQYKWNFGENPEMASFF